MDLSISTREETASLLRELEQIKQQTPKFPQSLVCADVIELLGTRREEIETRLQELATTARWY